MQEIERLQNLQSEFRRRTNSVHISEIRLEMLAEIARLEIQGIAKIVIKKLAEQGDAKSLVKLVLTKAQLAFLLLECRESYKRNPSSQSQ